MCTWIKETWTLVRLFFTKIPDTLKTVQTKYYPAKKYCAMMWCGVLMTRDKPEAVSWSTQNHERIHLEQAKLKGSWFKFYTSYLGEYLRNRFLFLGHDAAYFLISYEMQAYAHEYDWGYKVTSENMKPYKLSRKEKRDAWKQHNTSWWAFCRRLDK